LTIYIKTITISIILERAVEIVAKAV